MQGNRIKSVVKGQDKAPPKDAVVVDDGGVTLMPGLISAHCHMSYTGDPRMSDIPPEEHTLITLHDAKTILHTGVTAAVGAGTAKPRLDIVAHNEIMTCPRRLVLPVSGDCDRVR